MPRLTTEQRLEGYLDFEKEGLGPPNLMSFLRGIAFAEEHYESVKYGGYMPLYLHTSKDKPFVRLTRDEISKAWAQCDDAVIFAREIEFLSWGKNK